MVTLKQKSHIKVWEANAARAIIQHLSYGQAISLAIQHLYTSFAWKEVYGQRDDLP